MLLSIRGDDLLYHIRSNLHLYHFKAIVYVRDIRYYFQINYADQTETKTAFDTVEYIPASSDMSGGFDQYLTFLQQRREIYNFKYYWHTHLNLA